MASKYIRDMIDTWVKDPSMKVPFYPTINMEQDPPDDIWFTVEFSSGYKEKLTYCGTTSENGEVEIVFFGRPGIGYDTLLTALEADIKTLMAMRDPAQKMVLLDSSPPAEFSDGSADMSYEMSVFCEYIYFD